MYGDCASLGEVTEWGVPLRSAWGGKTALRRKGSLSLLEEEEAAGRLYTGEGGGRDLSGGTKSPSVESLLLAEDATDSVAVDGPPEETCLEGAFRLWNRPPRRGMNV